MKVIIYVEGRSDKLAMEVLLRDLISQKSLNGIYLEFFEAPPGDKKESVLNKVPVRAVNILRNEPEAVVLASLTFIRKTRDSLITHMKN